MNQKTRKILPRQQKLEYAKMMVEDGYSNQEIENISGASSSAVSRWKQQYQAEKQGITPTHKKAITPEHMRIQDLEKQ